LLKKEDRINITYDDSAVKGARLTKAKEKDILALIIQGKNNKSIADNAGVANLEFNFVNKAQSEATELIGREVDLFAGDSKLEFKISKFSDGYKTVVCKFSDDTESQLVKGVNFENLSTITINDNSKLSDIRTALNDVKIDTTNKKIFKDNAALNILPAGVDSNKLDDESKTTGTSCKFLVIDKIKKDDINPIFLKKKFTVELDSNETNKTIVEEVKNLIEDKLKGNFEDIVSIKVSDITTFLKTVQKSSVNDIFADNAFNDLKNVADIEGVKKSATINGNDVVDAENIKIKLKSAAFVATNIKTTIKLTLTAIGDQRRGDKVLKADIKTAIEKIFNDTNTVISKADFVAKFNDSNSGIQLADVNKKFAESDFEFNPNLTGDIDKDNTITLKKEFWDKLNDSCYVSPKEAENTRDAKTKEGNSVNQPTSDGTNGGSSDPDNKTKSGKYCDYGGKKEQ
jgi:hypothetical protein